MAYSQPARTAARWSRPVAYGTRNGHPGTYVSAVGWPLQGQAALVLGNDQPATSPGERPVPIASLAKVMTAYLTLKRYPLSDAQAGFAITITAAQVQAEARALGMDHTTYTDPSGFDPSTVSTAADRLRVFQQAIPFSVFRRIVSMPRVTLPVAGTPTNDNPLIAEGFPGKNGSDSAAGGCPAFFSQVMVGRRPVTAPQLVASFHPARGITTDVGSNRRRRRVLATSSRSAFRTALRSTRSRHIGEA